MMRVASVSYSDDVDRTRLKLSAEYRTADPLLQADIMKDLLELVTEEYAAAVRRFGDDIEARQKRAQQSGQ